MSFHFGIPENVFAMLSQFMSLTLSFVWNSFHFIWSKLIEMTGAKRALREWEASSRVRNESIGNEGTTSRAAGIRRFGFRVVFLQRPTAAKQTRGKRVRACVRISGRVSVITAAHTFSDHHHVYLAVSYCCTSVGRKNSWYARSPNRKYEPRRRTHDRYPWTVSRL